MRRIPPSLLLILYFASCFSRAWALLGVSLQMQLGNPSGATADSSNHTHYLIQRTVQALDYNDSLGEPNWASWDLTASDLGNSGRSPSFVTDTTLPVPFYEVTSSDYTNSGYDRGHLCPSADRTDTDANNLLVFYMSNILPQAPDNNQGPWENLESYCRSLAVAGNELLIICGGSYYNGFIPSGKAAIPGYTWKVVVVTPPGSGTALSRITTGSRVICVKVPNIAGIRSVPWAQYLTSARQIESDTSNIFFSNLPPSVAAVLRARVDGAPADSITGFTPTSGTVGQSVVISGSGFTGASSVLFNNTAASFNVDSDTQMTAIVPAVATSGTISVIAPGGQATSTNVFSVSSQPSIDSFSPASGPVGTSVNLTGSGFNSAQAVSLNGVSIAFTINSDTSITTTIPPGGSTGPFRVTVGGTTIASASSFNVTSPADILYISQIYGGGGNSGANYKNDFIEIFNAGTTTVDLTNYAVQYTGSTGTTWQSTPLNGTILPGHYYLIQEAPGNSGTLVLPTPQAVGSINLNATSGKVALTKTQTLLAGSNPSTNSAVVDFVGYGFADAYLGSAAVAALSSTTSATRAFYGGGNSNNNGADFTAASPVPENASGWDAWRARNFTTAELAQSSVSGPSANPSGDGLSNLLKYAFNLNPKMVNSAGAVSSAFQFQAGNQILTLTHRKNRYSADLVFQYEVSADLIHWNAAGSTPSSPVTLDAETSSVSLSVSTPTGQLFSHVLVTHQ